MKKIIIAAVLALGIMNFTAQDANAQVSVNVNIGSQPMWGPVGYDYVQYYYIPEYNVYYDVMSQRYIYLNGQRWIHARALPPRYGHIDMYRTYKVVVNQHNPYRHNNMHMRDYGHYRGHRDQRMLRDYGHRNGNYRYQDNRHDPYRGGGHHRTAGRVEQRDRNHGHQQGGRQHDNNRNHQHRR